MFFSLDGCCLVLLLRPNNRVHIHRAVEKAWYEVQVRKQGRGQSRGGSKLSSKVSFHEVVLQCFIRLCR